ncbi:hypothetical protein BC941DRAFT_472798 [Chlamydoabsidia padenii]|nr:hypothetical protein BC941DRAFT_472798 [Chlamydoabsidia padenii]
MALSSVAVSAVPFDRRGPAGPSQSQPDKTNPKDNIDYKKLDAFLSCLTKELSNVEVPMGKGKPGEDPLLGADSLNKCVLQVYRSAPTSQDGTGAPPPSQDGTGVPPPSQDGTGAPTP